MIKKIWLMVCLLVLLAANAQGQCSGSESIEGDYCYAVEDGKLTIAAYIGSDSDVIIPDTIDGMPVAAIGEKAFYINSSITNVTIPDSVVTIASQAFYSCRFLTGVIIPDSVITIETEAFIFCDSLTSMTIPGSVTSIGLNPFRNCDGLNNIFVDTTNSVYSSLDGVLFNKDKTVLIAFPAGRQGEYSIPDSVSIIESYAFYWCEGLTNVTLGNNVTSIGSSAFYHCDNLTNMVIPDSTLSIGDWAFAWCQGLNSLTLGNKVASIGMGAFEDCIYLTSLIIPDSVISIGDRAFNSCSRLTSITIPTKVNHIGESTFFACRRLASVTLPDSLTSIGREAFAYCNDLDNVIIPDSVIEIGVKAFYSCKSLASIRVPDSVVGIADYTFAECGSLTGIAIPDSVTSIGYGAFRNCDGLTSITLPDSLTHTGFGVFSDCSSLTSVIIPDSLTSIADSMFSGCASLTSVTIPNSIISIGVAAFSGCSVLTSVTIPDGVTTIEEYAFNSCTFLTSVTIPASVTGIGFFAFSDNPSLLVAYFLGNAPLMGGNVFHDTAFGFNICYTSDATGFSTPLWYGYSASDCSCSGNMDCLDDKFCNGEEICEAGWCVSSAAPCEEEEFCLEESDVCGECLNDSHCGILYLCEEAMCVRGPDFSYWTTVTLKGPGTMEVAFALDYINISGIELTDTTEDSSLIISSSLKQRPILLEALDIEGSLKDIKGKAVVLIGAMTATGGIAKMQIGATGAESTIEAAWIGKITIAGNAAGHVDLTGEETSPKGFTLDKASIKDSLVGSTWHVSGNIGSFKVGRWGAGSVLAVGVNHGPDHEFFTEDDEVTGGSLGKFKYKYYETYNNGKKFGIIAEEFLKTRFVLPLEENDFCIRQP